MRGKVEVYYKEERDAITLVQDGKVISYDEAVRSSEYLNEFGIDNIKGFEGLTGAEILETHENMKADFETMATEKEIADYYKDVRGKEIEGYLVTSKEV